MLYILGRIVWYIVLYVLLMIRFYIVYSGQHDAHQDSAESKGLQCEGIYTGGECWHWCKEAKEAP